jgi:predicted GNAT family acetyltransferase
VRLPGGRQAAKFAGVRTLDEGDRAALLRLLAPKEGETIFIGSRVASARLGVATPGGRILGFFRDGVLVSALYQGNNLMPVGDDDEALRAFADLIGKRQSTKAIMGPAAEVLALHRQLSVRWGETWALTRSLRPHQPVLLLDREPTVSADPRVVPVPLADLEPYYQAAVKMYLEEVGDSPYDASDSYRQYVHSLLRSRRAFGAKTGLDYWFKADVGAATLYVAQVQGVWLDRRYRGQGMSAALMAQALKHIRETWPRVSLYVNDYNVRARRMYAALGFKQVGEMATVLY